MPDILVQLEVTEANGGLSRDVIVAHTITFFNLHRAIQYCVKPRQSDSTVDGKVRAVPAGGHVYMPLTPTEHALLN